MGPDGCWYYAWLRSAAFDRDWDFSNERPDIAAHGSSRVGNKWSMGPAVLWAPFFATAYAVDHALPGLVRSIPRDYLGQGTGEYARTDIPGYSFPYRLAICVGTAFYGLLSALLVVALCRPHFGEGASWLAGLALLTATPLPFWMYKHPSWSHALSAFAVALVLAVSHWSRGMSLARRAGLLGALTGLAALVRWQDAVFGLVPVGTLLQQWRGDRTSNTVGPWLNAKAQRREGAEKGEEKAGNGESARAKDERQASSRGGPGLNAEAQRGKGAEKGEVRTENGGWRLPTAMLAFGAFSGAALIVFFPQMIGWHSVYGSWLVVPQGREFFDFAPRRLPWSLFSLHSGMLLWHPILLAGLVGLVLLGRRRDELGRLTRWALAAATLAVVVDGAFINEPEWYAGGLFGRRRLTCLLPLFGLGMAACFRRLWGRRSRAVLTGLVLLLGAFNWVLFLNTGHSGVPTNLVEVVRNADWSLGAIGRQTKLLTTTTPFFGHGIWEGIQARDLGHFLWGLGFVVVVALLYLVAVVVVAPLWARAAEDKTGPKGGPTTRARP
jgi:hypothetical protein